MTDTITTHDRAAEVSHPLSIPEAVLITALAACVACGLSEERGVPIWELTGGALYDPIQDQLVRSIVYASRHIQLDRWAGGPLLGVGPV